MLVTLPENAVFTKYGSDEDEDDADKAWYEGEQFAKCHATKKWELVTLANPVVDAIAHCGNNRTLCRSVNTIGNSVRLAQKWNEDGDTHPNQVITHLVVEGKEYLVRDRQMSLI